MKNDVDKSLRARCEDLLNCWRCGNALLEEDVECSYYTATNQLNRFGGLGCGTCGCPLPIALGCNSTRDTQEVSSRMGRQGSTTCVRRQRGKRLSTRGGEGWT